MKLQGLHRVWTGLLEPNMSPVPCLTLLACNSLLLLMAIFKFILNSVKLVFLLDCISYLIVDLPGFAPSSRL